MKNEWSFKTSTNEVLLPEKQIKQSLDLISEWRKHFPKENTWVQNNYGVPSVIIRIDCVIDSSDNLQVYEIEERPSGIGVTTDFNPKFKSSLGCFKEKWPTFNSIVSSRRDYCDDEKWLQSYEGNGSLVLVRAEPEEEDFYHLQCRSVSTMQTKGDKIYGEKMGLWRLVRVNDIENASVWAKGFCLKPLKGSKCQNVEIWHPVYKKTFKAGGGISTKSRIIKTIEEQGKMYLQEFIPPMVVIDDGEEKRMIYRIFFGYNPENQQYEYMGGFYNIRSSFKIHGAGDTVFGPIN